MPAAARRGDRNIPHCSAHTMSSGSSDVFVNARGACRQGDSTVSHLIPQGRRCGVHAASVTSGSSSVFINGRAAATVGSRLSSCTAIAQGSSDVFIGL